MCASFIWEFHLSLTPAGVGVQEIHQHADNAKIVCDVESANSWWQSQGTRKRRVLQGKSRQVGRVGADALSWLAGRLPNILFLECFFLLGRGDTILGMSSRGERDERETVLHQTL